jgi:hypothetical protein
MAEMNLKQKPAKAAAKDQSDHFKKTARDLGCDETPGALDRAFGAIDPKRPQSPKNPRL